MMLHKTMNAPPEWMAVQLTAMNAPNAIRGGLFYRPC